ncbi:MAG: flagellar biosynthesis protein FlgF [Planctomycetota bacterium]|nr:MAG: flagellar biosynthesis protein FlgF [Planctomycetota bacterium]
MPYGLYISAEGAQVQQRRLETIANNLANVETAGFKRDVAMFQARFAEAIQQGSDYPHSRTQNDIGGGVKIIDVATDFSSSSLRETGIPTDFAVNGDGFFKVRGPDGGVYLTRAGNFTLDARGRLITQSGDLPVLSESGSEIVIDDARPWEVFPGGRIVQDGSATAIGLVRPQSLGDLVKTGANLFRPLAPTSPVPADARDIRQGYLEQSGVNPTREMMAMIETSRAFEANMRLIQHQDAMISGLVNRVLSVTA